MTKAKLKSYLQLKYEAKNTYELWRKLEREKLSFSAPLDDMPKSSNKRTMSDVIAESDMLAHKYHKKYLRALKRLNTIEKFISSLDDELHRNILRLKYIEGKTWWRIEKELDFKYSERHLRRIRDKILEKCETCPPMSV